MMCPGCGSTEKRWSGWLGTRFHAECRRCGLEYNRESESFEEYSEDGIDDNVDHPVYPDPPWGEQQDQVDWLERDQGPDEFPDTTDEEFHAEVARDAARCELYDEG
jgi:hypothetical protein